MKNSSESLVVQSELKSILASFPVSRSDSKFCTLLHDNLTDGRLGKENIVANLLLNPCNISLECWLTWQKWNLFKDCPWKCLKASFDSIIFNLNPANLHALSEIFKSYKKLMEDLIPHRDYTDNTSQKEIKLGKV